MLKPLDILVALKIIASKGAWTQSSLAQELRISPSQVNNSLRQLIASKLFSKHSKKHIPIFSSVQDFLLYGFCYSFPVVSKDLTVGIPTAYAAQPLVELISQGNDPTPVWPYSKGKVRGFGVEPLHKNLPQALVDFPDEELQQFLALLDVLRIGKAREKSLAITLLKEKLEALAKEAYIE